MRRPAPTPAGALPALPGGPRQFRPEHGGGGQGRARLPAPHGRPQARLREDFTPMSVPHVTLYGPGGAHL
ncbi:hypothetical protein [Streptomyces sp. NPDC096351]|uniref:hypothetical protein n=1 Tax=Streptomyces sp. NPDC096351 TaxID=3366087 RepID=UPI003829233C